MGQRLIPDTDKGTDSRHMTKVKSVSVILVSIAVSLLSENWTTTCEFRHEHHSDQRSHKRHQNDGGYGDLIFTR